MSIGAVWGSLDRSPDRVVRLVRCGLHEKGILSISQILSDSLELAQKNFDVELASEFIVLDLVQRVERQLLDLQQLQFISLTILHSSHDLRQSPTLRTVEQNTNVSSEVKFCEKEDFHDRVLVKIGAPNDEFEHVGLVNLIIEQLQDLTFHF